VSSIRLQIVSTVGPVSKVYPESASEPARPVLSFEHGDAPACRRQANCRGQATEPGADDHDVVAASLDRPHGSSCRRVNLAAVGGRKPSRNGGQGMALLNPGS
jgi:hypothetical protein